MGVNSASNKYFFGMLFEMWRQYKFQVSDLNKWLVILKHKYFHFFPIFVDFDPETGLSSKIVVIIKVD